MATNTNTFKTRVQLKSDTEANWNKAGPKDGSAGFIPLLGELIVYTADDAHHFCRLKVGDGSTNVVNLPFIDAGTINGELLPSAQVVTYNTRSSFPSPGETNKLYIDLSTSSIYCFANASGYTQLSNFEFSVTKSTIGSVTNWLPGVMTTAKIEDNTFKVTNGLLPELLWEFRPVVTDVTKEVSE